MRKSKKQERAALRFSGSGHHGRNAVLAAALTCAGVLTVAVPAHAQSIFSAEGILTAASDAGGGAGSITCNGTVMQLSANTVLRSPTKRLTMAELVDPTPFPAAGVSPLTGLPRAGFVGGTCISDGVRDDITGVLNVNTLFVEVAENGLVGAVTHSPALGNGAFAVIGTPVVPATDPRVSAVKLAAGFFGPTGAHAGFTEEVRNQYGFGVDLNTVGLPAPDLASASGHLGTDGVLYAWSIDTTEGTLLRADPRPTIQKLTCRNNAAASKDQLEIRGGCVLPTAGVAQTVTFTAHAADGTVIQQYPASATCTPDTAAPPFGAYRYSRSNLQFLGDACPAKISATLTGAAPDRRDFINLQ